MSDTLKQLLTAERVPQGTFQEIVRMLFHYDVLPSTRKPVLVCWLAGPAAVMAETLSSHAIGLICHEVLCNYMNVDQKKYRPVQTLRYRPMPIRLNYWSFCRSAWHSNQYIRGSYSFFSMNSTKHDGQQLRAPYTPDGVGWIVELDEIIYDSFRLQEFCLLVKPHMNGIMPQSMQHLKLVFVQRERS